MATAWTGNQPVNTGTILDATQTYSTNDPASLLFPLLFGQIVGLIGTIELTGQRILNVYLVGKRELNVNLKGVV